MTYEQRHDGDECDLRWPCAARGLAAAAGCFSAHGLDDQGDRGRLRRPLRRARGLACLVSARPRQRHARCGAVDALRRGRRQLRCDPRRLPPLDLEPPRARQAGAADRTPLSVAGRPAARHRGDRPQSERTTAVAGALRGGHPAGGGVGRSLRSSRGRAPAAAPALGLAGRSATRACGDAATVCSRSCGECLGQISFPVAARGAVHLHAGRPAAGDTGDPARRTGGGRCGPPRGFAVAAGSGAGPDRWRSGDDGGSRWRPLPALAAAAGDRGSVAAGGGRCPPTGEAHPHFPPGDQVDRSERATA